MLQQKTNPKNNKKLGTQPNNLSANIPDTWEEFTELLKIKSGEHYKPFKAYEYQKRLIDLCEHESTVLAIKSRQLGVTQTIASYFLFKACRNPAYSAICFSRSQDDVSALSRRVRDMALQLEQYGIELLIDNVGLIKLKGLGEIYFKNSSKEGSRSYDSISDFLFDEASFVPTIESIYSASSASSSMVSKSLKVIVSTPGSKLSWFYKQANQHSKKPIDITCKEVAEGTLPPFYSVNEGGLCKVFIHWKAHPVYSLKTNYLEYRQQQDQTPLEVVNREYNLAFEEIGEGSIFNTQVIIELSTEEPTTDVYSDYEYYIGIDTATVGDDYFCVVVFSWDGQIFKQCYIWRDRKKTNDFYLLKSRQIIDNFNPVLISIESNSIGEGIYQQLFNYYPNYEFNKFFVSQNSKQSMIGHLQVYLESKLIRLLDDENVRADFLNFVRDGHKLQAVSGHDDIVLACAFALSGFIKMENEGQIQPFRLGTYTVL